uniref:Uncharacterized protein n=1 Tax=Sparus aurata TaxID=8175 RepID=A0A671Y5T5_SPAAU
MFSGTMLLSAVVLTLLAVSVEASTGGGTSNYNLSGSDLRRLYNSKVYKAELMKRPLAGLPIMWGPISHSGVRVTLANGSRWLIHKGKGYGVSSDTVVVNARYMSREWRAVMEGNFRGRKTVANFVATGGSRYHWLFDNCHWASIRMIKQ